jgi:hypothetical protein
VVARLKAAGAIVVGKTNGPCFWGQDSVLPPTRCMCALRASSSVEREDVHRFPMLASVRRDARSSIDRSSPN